jgi:hypothetical protein
MQPEYQLGTPLHPALAMGINRRTLPGYMEVTRIRGNSGMGYGIIPKWNDPIRGEQTVYVPLRLTTSWWHPYLIPLYGYVAFFQASDVDAFFQGEFYKGENRINRYYGVQLDY